MDWTMLNLVQLRSLLRELVIVQGYKVEVYEEYLGPCEWEPVYGSPGNLSCVEHYIFSNELHDSISSCKVMALQIAHSKLVIAIVDAETKEASFSEFDESDNAQARFQMKLSHRLLKTGNCHSEPSSGRF